MATTYLIKLETIQFDELDCATASPLLNGSIPDQIQYTDANNQVFFKTLTSTNTASSVVPTNGNTIISIGSLNPDSCNISNKALYGYETTANPLQIVQLETPAEFQHSIEMSDSSSNTTTELNSTSSAVNLCDKIKLHQRKLNKYVRIRFREEFGPGFLLTHDLHECDQVKFERLRKEALTLFKPPGVSERTAWARAKQSLRLMRNAMLKHE